MKNSLPEPPKKEPKKRGFSKQNLLPVLSWIAWIVFAFFASSFVVGIILAIFVYSGAIGESWYDDNAVMAVVNIVIYLVILAIALLPWWVRRKRSRKKSGEKLQRADHKRDWREAAKLVGLSRRPRLSDLGKFLSYVPAFYAVLLAASFVLAIILGSLVGSDTATEILNQEQNVGFATPESQQAMLWILQLILIGVSLVLVAPVAEEMLTRGLLFGRLRQHLSFWPTAIIVSILFALAHGQWNAGVMTFILSMFSCHLREKTGAIWASIGLHMLVNLVAFSLRFVAGIG